MSMTQLPQCRGFTKSGQPCQMMAGEDGWCFNHRPDPAAEEARREARSRGGSVGKARTLDLTQVAVRFKSAQDVTNLLADLCQWVLTGQVDVKTANSAVYAASAALRTFDRGGIPAGAGAAPDNISQQARDLANWIEEQAERMETDSIRLLASALRDTPNTDPEAGQA